MPFDLQSEPVEHRSTPIQVGSIIFEDGEFWSDFLGQNRGLTDEPLTRKIVAGIPAVAAAVSRIADIIASLPLFWFTDGPQGRQRATTDPLYSILTRRVNDALSSHRWRQIVMNDVLLSGRHISLIRRNKAGRVHSIWPLELKHVTIHVIDGLPTYTHTVPGQKPETYSASQILDFVWKPTGLHDHLDPIVLFRDEFGACRAADRYSARMFKNGGLPAAYLTGPADMTAKTYHQAHAQLGPAVARSAETGIPPLLPSGFELKTIGLSPEHLQLLDLKRFQIEQIARIYGIPPSQIQDLSRGTYSNVEQADIHMVKWTLAPFISMLEAEFNLKLAPNSSAFAEFVVDGLLRGDISSRYTAYRTQIYSGIRSPNEVRALENLPPSDLDNADKLFIQGATMPLDAVGQAPVNPTNLPQDEQDPAAPGMDQQ